MKESIIKEISKNLNIKEKQIQTVLELLKEGNTVDFKLIETAKGLQAVDVEEVMYAVN